jgi:chromosome segregation ATPase
LENDKRSLQTALDQTLAETSRLSRRLTESENALTAARARLEQMDISLAAAENERVTLATARDEANERHQSEAYAMNLRLEALRSRAATAEKLLAEVRQTLAARTEDIRVLERKAVEATIARNSTEKVVERLTVARDGLDTKTRELEQARASLTERSSSLAETLKARETALAHAEQKIKSLTDRIAEIEVTPEPIGPRPNGASTSSMRAFSASASSSPLPRARWRRPAGTMRGCNAIC